MLAKRGVESGNRKMRETRQRRRKPIKRGDEGVGCILALITSGVSPSQDPEPSLSIFMLGSPVSPVLYGFKLKFLFQCK